MRVALAHRGRVDPQRAGHLLEHALEVAQRRPERRGLAVIEVRRPADVAAFRRSAFALGFWGSVAVPFLLPLLNLAFTIGGS